MNDLIEAPTTSLKHRLPLRLLAGAGSIAWATLGLLKGPELIREVLAILF
jgi:hypothetical protein